MFKKNSFYTVFIFCSFFIATTYSTCIAEHEGRGIDSIIIISSPEEHICGSGTISSDGKILTSSHLLRAICRDFICPNLKLYKSDSSGNSKELFLDDITLKVIDEFPGLDLGFVIPADSNIKLNGSFNLENYSSISSPSPIKINQKVFSLSFPNCEKPQIKEGKIINIDDLSITTDIPGLKGESGGAIFTHDKKLVGIIDESATLTQGIFSSMFGRSFNIKAIRTDIISQIQGEEKILIEAEIIYNYYRNNVLNDNSSLRLLKTLHFLSLVAGLKNRALVSNLSANIIKPFLYSDNYPSLSFFKNQNDYFKFNLLTFAAALEQKGFNKSLFKKIKKEAFLQDLSNLSLTQEQNSEITILVNHFSNMNYDGYQFMNATRYIFVLLIIIPLLFLWSWSLGFIFAKIPGSFFKKLLIMFCFGIFLWPFSLLFFGKYLKRHN